MKNKITEKDREELLAKEIKNVKKWINPKTKAIALDMNGRVVFHNEEGPALINKEQRRKEYYLNGIEFDYDTWNEIMKGKEGLPWYKNPSMKGTSRH